MRVVVVPTATIRRPVPRGDVRRDRLLRVISKRSGFEDMLRRIVGPHRKECSDSHMQSDLYDFDSFVRNDSNIEFVK